MKTSFIIAASLVAAVLGREIASAQTATAVHPDGTVKTISKNKDGSSTLTTTTPAGKQIRREIPQPKPGTIMYRDAAGNWVEWKKK